MEIWEEWEEEEGFLLTINLSLWTHILSLKFNFKVSLFIILLRTRFFIIKENCKDWKLIKINNTIMLIVEEPWWMSTTKFEADMIIENYNWIIYLF